MLPNSRATDRSSAPKSAPRSTPGSAPLAATQTTTQFSTQATQISARQKMHAVHLIAGNAVENLTSPRRASPHSARPIPMVVLSPKDQRTLIHTLAILHAHCHFAHLVIGGGDNSRQLAKTLQLAHALNLQDYVSIDLPTFNSRRAQQAPATQVQIFAWITPEKNLESLAAEPAAQNAADALPGCAVFCVDGLNTGEPLHEELEARAVPSQDPQALARVLEGILVKVSARYSVNH